MPHESDLLWPGLHMSKFQSQFCKAGTGGVGPYAPEGKGEPGQAACPKLHHYCPPAEPRLSGSEFRSQGQEPTHLVI